MSLIIGLTGGIGSGKSAAAEIFASLGAEVIDTDLIARELTRPGAPALAEIAAKLGAEFILPDGSLDRAALRRRVFSDSTAKQTLETILHPRIRHRAAELLARSHTPYVLLVVPLLIETGAYRDIAQRILVVDCPEEIQISRTMARSGLSAAETRAILANQVSRAERLSRADDVIDNGGDRETLYTQVATLDSMYRSIS